MSRWFGRGVVHLDQNSSWEEGEKTKKGKGEERRKEKEKEKGKEIKERRKGEESRFYWFSSTLARRVHVQKGAGLHSKVGSFSYYDYSCLRAIQWLWGLA